MSRTRHAERAARCGVGKDYNGRRPGNKSFCVTPGRFAKRRTHRMERQLGKHIVEEVE
jgi:hypothetical protein